MSLHFLLTISSIELKAMQILKAVQLEENLKRVNGGSMAQWVEMGSLTKANLQSESQFCYLPAI